MGDLGQPQSAAARSALPAAGAGVADVGTRDLATTALAAWTGRADRTACDAEPAIAAAVRHTAESAVDRIDAADTADAGVGDPARSANGLIAKRSIDPVERSEEHTSELQSLMRISYAVFCLKK